MSTVIGVFNEVSAAERAVRKLREQGFTESEISILARDEQQGGQDMEAGEEMGGQDIADGTAWGGALGGLAGLLAGAGALAIPGIGPILAAGPLAGALSGAVGGGVVGGLIDLGIPEEEGRKYEAELKRGGVLTVIETSGNKAAEAGDVLRQSGARDVEMHGGEYS